MDRIDRYSEWELEYWKECGMLEGNPVRTVAGKDNSRPYEMDRFGIIEMDTGKFATILESGCSCYDYSQAQIDHHKASQDAFDSMRRWESGSY